jgi:Serine/threonine protein kinase
MEFIGTQSLQAYLKSRESRKLEEAEAKHIFKQVVQGVDYLHKKNIVHRDIKLENLLLGPNNQVKIIDFGFSIITPKDKKLNIFCGTPSYMAPELASRKEYYGHLADIWAMGILLFALLTGHFPFKGTFLLTKLSH